MIVSIPLAMLTLAVAALIDTEPGGREVAVTGQVQRVRLIMVSDEGWINGIWSNAAETDSGSYLLRVRTGQVNGPKQPMTDAVLDQYKPESTEGHRWTA